MKVALILFLIVLLPCQVFAVYDKSKLDDWQWHAHFCKNVSLGLGAIALMENKLSPEIVDKERDYMEQSLVKNIFSKENEVYFDQQDMMLITNTVFSIRAGMKDFGVKLTTRSAMNDGFNSCVYILGKMDEELAGN